MLTNSSPLITYPQLCFCPQNHQIYPRPAWTPAYPTLGSAPECMRSEQTLWVQCMSHCSLFMSPHFWFLHIPCTSFPAQQHSLLKWKGEEKWKTRLVLLLISSHLHSRHLLRYSKLRGSIDPSVQINHSLQNLVARGVLILWPHFAVVIF